MNGVASLRVPSARKIQSKHEIENAQITETIQRPQMGESVENPSINSYECTNETSPPRSPGYEGKLDCYCTRCFADGIILIIKLLS